MPSDFGKVGVVFSKTTFLNMVDSDFATILGYYNQGYMVFVLDMFCGK